MDLTKYKEYFESPEFKKETEEYFIKLRFQNDLLNDRLERFHLKYKDNLDYVIEKIITKYSSAKYRDKEYKLHREPQEDLYHFLIDYARKYSKICENETYYNDFTGECYYIGSYVIQLMHGQGTCVMIEKINDEDLIDSFSVDQLKQLSLSEMINYVKNKLKNTNNSVAYCTKAFIELLETLQNNIKY